MNDKKATWIIQSSGLKPIHGQKLMQALTELNEPFCDIGMNRKEGILAGIDPQLGTNVIPYGSVNIVKLAAVIGWKHCFFNEHTFNVRAWQRNREDMLNFATIMTLDDLTWHLEDTIEPDSESTKKTKLFLRPVRDLKEFAGFVDTVENLRAWVEKLRKTETDLSIHTEVAVSTPKDIQMEWRYFIVGGKIVSGSSYRWKGEPRLERVTEKNVLEEAQKMADFWLPHPCCVMDLALCKDKVKVVEFNGLNASGFYDHDIKAIVKAISEYANK